MFNFLLTAAEAAEGAEEVTGAAAFLSRFGTPIMLVLMIVLLYFVMIRPQKKQEKEAQNMRDSLAVGDEITTIGGVIGEIVSIKDETVTIETSKAGTKIRFLKSAIRSVDVKASDKKIQEEE
ncbi:MAG: preprotein translocase subunit YajC [Clostridia bacterium]|nr:preprotein translocase subunit YajC [Clostridia bacterium]